jgi:uncharacterized membrane protein
LILQHFSTTVEVVMTTNPVSTARIGGHPIHPMLIPFPVAFLVGAFVTDLTFWSTGTAFWAQASMWLLGAALVMAALAAVAGLTDFMGDTRIRALSDAWHHMIGNVIAVVLALINFGLRYMQGAETAIRPWGLVLSAVVVGILLFTGWKGWEMVYRHRVGIAEAPEQMSGMTGTPVGRSDTHRHAA